MHDLQCMIPYRYDFLASSVTERKFHIKILLNSKILAVNFRKIIKNRNGKNRKARNVKSSSTVLNKVNNLKMGYYIQIKYKNWKPQNKSTASILIL